MSFHYAIKYYFKIIITLVSLIVIINISTDSVKKSSKGHYFIISNLSKEIIINRYVGKGINSFENNYGLIQSNYFIENPKSRYINIADNVSFALCDPLQLIYEQGVVVFIFYLFLFSELLIRIFKSKSKSRFYLILLFGSIIVLSLFQYPFYIQENLIPIIFYIGVLNSFFDNKREISFTVFNLISKCSFIFYCVLICIIFSLSTFNVFLNLIGEINYLNFVSEKVQPYLNRNQRFLNLQLKNSYLNNDFKNSLLIIQNLEKFQKSNYLFYLKSKCNLENTDTISAVKNLNLFIDSPRSKLFKEK